MRGVQSADAIAKVCPCGATFMTNGNTKHCYVCRSNRPPSTKPARGRYKQYTPAPMRVTHTTFLPACTQCHSYPATLINGAWDCGRHHG